MTASDIARAEVEVEEAEARLRGARQRLADARRQTGITIEAQANGTSLKLERGWNSIKPTVVGRDFIRDSEWCKLRDWLNEVL